MSYDPVPLRQSPFDNLAQKRRKRPIWVALTGLRYDAVRLAGAPPDEGFLGVESVAASLRVNGRSARGGEDFTTIRRETEHMSYLLSPENRSKTIHVRTAPGKGVSFRILIESPRRLLAFTVTQWEISATAANERGETRCG
jgi:hypothetical protein